MKTVMLYLLNPAWRRCLLLGFLLASLLGAESPATFDIQAALDALPPSGGMVRIPAGTYELKQPLVIRTGDVKLEGAGAATHLVTRAPGRQPAILIKHADYPKVRTARLWRVTLADFRVSGTKESGDGIRAEGIDEIYLRGVAIDHHGGHGVVLKDCYEDPRVIGNIITYNAAAGLLLQGCHDVVVSSNQFEENQDAVRCLDGFNLCMTGNNLDDHLRHGVVIENTYGSIVSGNMIEECNGTAVILDRDCYGITISANTIAHHLRGGVHVADGWGCAITGNTFPLVHAGSIRVGPGSGRLSISGNTFSNSFIGGKNKRQATHKDPMGRDAGTGILLEGTQDIVITGNVFGGLETPAVTASKGCTRLLITNNIVADVNRNSPLGTAAIVLGDATDCIVKDNLGADPGRSGATP